MIELPVDPTLDDNVDVAKVHHHASMIQCGCFNLDLGFGVVPVQMPALATVIQ